MGMITTLKSQDQPVFFSLPLIQLIQSIQLIQFQGKPRKGWWGSTGTLPNSCAASVPMVPRTSQASACWDTPTTWQQCRRLKSPLRSARCLSSGEKHQKTWGKNHEKLGNLNVDHHFTICSELKFMFGVSIFFCTNPFGWNSLVKQWDDSTIYIYKYDASVSRCVCCILREHPIPTWTRQLHVVVILMQCLQNCSIFQCILCARNF